MIKPKIKEKVAKTHPEQHCVILGSVSQANTLLTNRQVALGPLDSFEHSCGPEITCLAKTICNFKAPARTNCPCHDGDLLLSKYDYKNLHNRLDQQT